MKTMRRIFLLPENLSSLNNYMRMTEEQNCYMVKSDFGR